jgi:hypothetical protein
MSTVSVMINWRICASAMIPILSSLFSIIIQFLSRYRFGTGYNYAMLHKSDVFQHCIRNVEKVLKHVDIDSSHF